MKEELPTGRHLSRQAIADNFAWLTEQPTQYESLAFKLLVPSSWRRDRSDAYGSEFSAARLLPLAILAGPQSNGFVQVQAMRLNREISAEHWLRHFLNLSGYNIRNSVILSLNFVDSLADFVIEGHNFVGRFAARIHGDVVFLISAFCDRTAYDGMAELLGLCIASFQPLGRPSGPTIEGRVVTRLSDFAGFQRPASWAMRVVPDAPAGKAALDLMASVEGVAVGFIRFKRAELTADATFDQQVGDAVSEFSEAGYRVAGNWNAQPVDMAGNRFFDGGLAVLSAETGEGARQELWIIVFRDSSAYFTVSLLTPDRQSNFLIWAENRRALDIILETLQ